MFLFLHLKYTSTFAIVFLYIKSISKRWPRLDSILRETWPWSYAGYSTSKGKSD